MKTVIIVTIVDRNGTSRDVVCESSTMANIMFPGSPQRTAIMYTEEDFYSSCFEEDEL